MAIELDHFFICTSVGAPEGDRLTSLGFREGPPNVHRGQGTSNRRFFFRNGMIELLYVHDAAEAQSEPAGRTLLFERWSQRQSNASPFGFIFRPRGETPVNPPFPGWEYRPKWLEGPEPVHVADSGLDEPMWIYMSFLKPRSADDFTPHPNGASDITAVTLWTPNALCSDAAMAVFANRALGHRLDGEHIVDVTLDGGASGRTYDLRPDLPLRLYA
jgi:hypothetical protein